MELVRYMLFAGEEYYPCGGMEDFKGHFATIAELVERIGRYDWFNVYDLVTHSTVDTVMIYGADAERIRAWAQEIDARNSGQINLA